MEEDIRRFQPEVDWEYEAAKNKWERILEGMPESDDPIEGYSESPFKNGVETTLGTSMTSTDTTMTVSSYNGFPTTPFKVLVGNEEVWVTKVSGHYWECMRGVGETIPISHPVGDRIISTRVESKYVYKRNGD